MAEIVIVGDGPGGLSAALFLARGGHKVTVVGADKTAMHFAHLNNYLGAPDTMGTALQETARAQVVAAGAIITAGTVTNVSPRPPATRSTPKTGPRCRPTTCCCRRGGSTRRRRPRTRAGPFGRHCRGPRSAHLPRSCLRRRTLDPADPEPGDHLGW